MWLYLFKKRKRDDIIDKNELKLFYELDPEYYLVSKNKKLKKILSTLNSKYSSKDIQNFINKLISWYSVKFSNHYLDKLQKDNGKIDSTLPKSMDLEALKKRYTTFEKELFRKNSLAEGKVILQKQLIVAVGWGLIYHKGTTPEYGFYRASKLLQDFNNLFGWNLSPNIYKKVFDFDYSLDNPEVVKILHNKMKQKKEVKEDFSKGKCSIFKKLIKRKNS